jgi:uncharacterized protein YbbC (DUF1343 family)
MIHPLKMQRFILTTGIFLAAVLMACPQDYDKIITGAERTESYVPGLKDLNVALVINQTSVIGDTRLVDSLLNLGINIVTIFTPEHGLQGAAEAGEKIDNRTDPQTGIKVVSLYGDKRKPDPADLSDIDLVIFDIQDVGTRFYTYISTLHYIMQACAENGVGLLVLDRPNPNSFYVDGPVLEPEYRSFAGMHPVPVVYGMTMAEYARMINGEGWLGDNLTCCLSWVTCQGYDHSKKYRLPVNPSPNLRTMNAIYLYPSLCFFEGTALSVGRGTDFPFEVFGHPDLQNAYFTFTPESNPGTAADPLFKGRECRGADLRFLRNQESDREKRINIEWLMLAYEDFPDKEHFFNDYFENLAGTRSLREQISNGWTEEKIRESWRKGIQGFRTIRQKYLLYPDK